MHARHCTSYDLALGVLPAVIQYVCMMNVNLTISSVCLTLTFFPLSCLFLFLRPSISVDQVRRTIFVFYVYIFVKLCDKLFITWLQQNNLNAALKDLQTKNETLQACHDKGKLNNSINRTI